MWTTTTRALIKRSRIRASTSALHSISNTINLTKIAAVSFPSPSTEQPYTAVVTTTTAQQLFDRYRLEHVPRVVQHRCYTSRAININTTININAKISTTTTKIHGSRLKPQLHLQLRRYYYHNNNTNHPHANTITTAATTTFPNQQQVRTVSQSSIAAAASNPNKKRHRRRPSFSKSNNTPKSQRHERQKRNRKRNQPIGQAVVDTGISLEDCSQILVRACSGVREIPLNKRQRLKPWIMAVLLHRYDRGIRDIDQLNNDSVYYWDNNGRSNTNNSDDTNNNTIDLRQVLTPHQSQVDDFINRNMKINMHSKTSTATIDDDKNGDNINDGDDGMYDFTPKGQKRAEDFLRNEKMALLATEARRIVSDRKIPLLELVPSLSYSNGSSSTFKSYGSSSSLASSTYAHAPPSLLKTEAAARKLSKQDPALFLSLFSRAVAIAEKKKFQRFDAAALAKQKQTSNDDDSNDDDNSNGGTTATTDALVEDFSYRRYQPPSLKKAVYHKRKDRERKEKDRAAAAMRHQQKQHANSMGKKGHHSKVVRKKLSAMSKTKKQATNNLTN